MAIQGNSASSGISQLVERRIGDWERQAREDDEATREKTARQVKFYLAISRECGCDASQIAGAIEKRTGFQRFDHEILDYMAENDDLRRSLYETLDDRTMGWIESICSSLSMGPAVNEVEYFNRLSRTLLGICHNAHAIVIGRAANFILPPVQGLAIRLVAPQHYRLERYAQRHDLDLKTAMRQMERIDHDRGNFVETHFGRYAFDPRRYDIVINVSQFSSQQIEDMILLAMTSKAGDQKLPLQPTKKK